MTKAEVARIIGRKDTTCRAVRIAHDITRRGYKLLGTRLMTWRYRGPTVWRRIKTEFPGAARIQVLSFGRKQGEDEVAVFAPPPKGSLPVWDERAAEHA